MDDLETGVGVAPRRSKRTFGLCLSAVLELAACSSDSHPFGLPAGAAGAAQSGGAGGEGAGNGSGDGTGGMGGGGTGGGGTGGSEPDDCETDDPHCRCVDGVVVARDEDGDGAGTRLCAAAPGTDCDDGNGAFIQDACGGCDEAFAGLVEGGACGPSEASSESHCGVVTCDGDVISCVTPTPVLGRCTATTRELCENGQWVQKPLCDTDSSYTICHEGRCVECVPGTYACGKVIFGHSSSGSAWTATYCGPTGSYESSWTTCSSSQLCTPEAGCTGMLFHPRDADFEVVPLLASPPILQEGGRSVGDVLDGAIGIDFG